MTSSMFWAVAEDVTDERLREAQISHLASHDTLTGLANRWMFQQKLEAAANIRNPASTLVAIHCVDLDGFKAVNDAWSHPAGDEVLKMAASRMRNVVRQGDLVARLGGDEFAILQHSLKRARDVKTLSRRVVTVLSGPYVINGTSCEIGASVGVCLAQLHLSMEL